MKRIFRFIFCISIILTLYGCAGREATPTVVTPFVTPTPTVFVTPTPVESAEAPVRFSDNDDFSSESKEITIIAEGASKIYYSLDGSIPSETSKEFTAPITLRTENKVKAYCVTARALYPNGTWSDPYVHTYLIGKNAEKRFDTLVFSITTDPKGLWDYDIGIFVRGRIFDEYMKKHPRAQVNGGTPANYNQLRGMDGEREAYVEVFYPDGSLLLEQRCGIRTYGGWSRANNLKSVKLLARKEYGDKTFDYPFFETALDENNNVIDVFKRLVLRGHGNDNGFAFIREELFQNIAGAAGYLQKNSRPCAVFINGEYYGCYWLTENWHKSYFENHFGEFKGKLEILEGEEKKLSTEDEESQYAAEDFKKFYEEYAYKDLRDDEVYEKLLKEMDVKEYIETYAFRIFLADNDWPQNNYKAYKYYPAPGEHFEEGPYDGRWHFLLHDMDYSSGIYGESYSGKNMLWALGSLDGVKNNVSPLFGHLMQRSDCKEIFIKKMLELCNGAFSPKYFNTVIDSMNKSRLNEQHYMYSSGKIDGWIQENQLKGQIDNLKKWIKSRGSFMITHIYGFFKLTKGQYYLKVKVPEGSEISIGGWTVKEDFTGRYFYDVDVDVTGLGGANGRITGWMVNEEYVEGEKLVINGNAYSDDACEVVPVFDGKIPEKE